MSKSSYVAASLVSIGLAFLPNASSAAVIQTSQELLSVCPALSFGTGCAEGATEYLDAAQPSNAQIISLVTSIASAADTPQVPKPICLDAAQGIRILAGGVSNAGQRQQILAIANDLCKGSATAAIPALVGSTFNNGNGYFSSNGGAGASGGNGDNGGNGGNGGSGGGGDNGGGGDGLVCAGNSQPGNGNNCDNPNQSHAH